ncbi:protein phosphatase 2A regulatory B subunit, B56 family protein (macronuclear) [Tetrahymena thermophila SB210]|uniref:Protein phosphatase 2A regulatory B subunit, B56 family protein n=1 Tax=Tetrahymena thermophila (strain SB210) TaxID=312017 RepID=Q240J1_TETTS|nr:protein phosphatase 2A regulatory B subunit, B56 family protein [Tetrahymena thermophila SB210]EAS02217.1 protein phosphatase 2A regulatory B subunit, B56 family protein [Tetrahymena thermophila SB210]|eukprot:XP_001022462.1 protein phosphatase 2A regulatory B subunit, B56 family protein [Tetrahymena thermophila SB210]
MQNNKQFHSFETLSQQLKNYIIRKKPTIKEINDSFLDIILFCSIEYDLNDLSKNQKEKQQQINYIKELNEQLGKFPTDFEKQNMLKLLFIPNMKLIIDMISINLFRRPAAMIKEIKPNLTYEFEVIETNPQRERFKCFSDFLLFIVIETEQKYLKKFITKQFICEFVQSFNREDSYEKDELFRLFKNLYCFQYARNLREALYQQLRSLIHEDYKLEGVQTILWSIYQFTRGFTTPLREEHVITFKSVLIPLYKVKLFEDKDFFNDLEILCHEFISKDSSLAYSLLEAIIRYWPYDNTQKQLIFLNIILGIIEICECQSLKNIIQKLLWRLAQCITGSNLQVADRAMCFFENESFLKVFIYYKALTYPLFTYSICQLANNHWHPVMKQSFTLLKTIIKDLDNQSFEEALAQKSEYFFPIVNGNIKLIYKNEEKWKIIFAQAKQKDPSISEPIFIDTNVITENNILNKKYIRVGD